MNRRRATDNRQHVFSLPLSTFYFLPKILSLLIFLLTLSPLSAFAQFGSSTGLTLQLIGIVQVEPGSNVITLGIKDTEIRFQIQDVVSTIRDFSSQQFLSDLHHRSPSLWVKGPEHLLDLLIKEKPNKRALKLSGIYYSDSRRFLMNAINTVQESGKPQF